jgi:hypothetical protein
LPSLDNSQTIDDFHDPEAGIGQNDLASNFHAPGFVDASAVGGATVVQSHDSVSLNEWAPGSPIVEQPLLAVVAVNEHEVHGLMATRCRQPGVSNPQDSAVPNRSNLPVSDPSLRTEPQSARPKWIDGRENTIRSHHCPEVLRCHAMPHTDFDQTTSSARMTHEAFPLERRRLRLGSGEAD